MRAPHARVGKTRAFDVTGCIVAFATLMLLCGAPDACSATPVVIGLQSSWGATPIIQEASEWLAQEDKSFFWKLVEAAFDQNVTLASTDQQQYELAIRVAESVLSNDQVKVMRIMLAARSQSAAVEMHRSLAVRDAPSSFDHSVVDAAFALVGSRTVSSPHSLDSVLRDASVASPHGAAIFDWDHASGTPVGSDALTVIVYGNLGSPTLKAFHEVLRERQNIVYVLRHRPPPSSKRVRVPGFGVEMHLKSTEYKVIDDNAASKAPASLTGNDFELEPVPKAEVTQLGVKIAHAIASSSQPLEMLQRLSQNFPTECHLFRNEQINASFVSSIEKLQKRVQRGHTAVLINGRHVPVENVNFFELIDVLSEEVRRSAELRAIAGLTSAAARTLTIRSDESASPAAGSKQNTPYFDLRSAHLYWVNNVETDSLNREWRKGLQGFLVQQWPGQPYLIRRNVFHIVFVLDLASASGLDTLLQVWSVVGSMDRGTLGPARLGVIPVGSSAESVMLAKAWHVWSHEDPRRAMQLLHAAHAALSSPKALLRILEEQLSSVGLSVDLLLESEESYPGTERSNAWADSFGFPGLDKALYAFVNGKRVEFTDNIPPLHAIARATMEMTREVQLAVYQNQLTDSEEDIHAWWLDSRHAQQSFSIYGGASDEGSPFVSLTKPGILQQIKKHLHFVGHCDPYCIFSYIVVADISSTQGLVQARNALSRLLDSKDKNARVAFAWHQSVPSEDLSKLSSEVEAYLRAGNILAASKLIDGALAGSLKDVSVTIMGNQLRTDRALEETFSFVKGVFGSSLSATSVVVNGRVFSLDAVERKKPIGVADFKAIEAHEFRVRGSQVSNIVHYGDSSADPVQKADSIMLVCSLLGLDETMGLVRHDMSAVIPQRPISVGGESGDAKIIIDALLDPLSPAGKKFSSILLKILSAFQAEVNLWLNPVLELEDLPLKQYYRYVASTDLQFDSHGSIDSAIENRALFEGLPSKTLFSMSLDVPDSWVVDTIAAPYDLDNLRIADVGGVARIGALYELTHLLVEGNCKDITEGAEKAALQVRGMQLQLSSGDKSYESLVMEMGGYFQLKSTPGVWTLSLRGRSADLYSIRSEDRVAVRNFAGFSRSLQVARRNSTDAESLLPADVEADEKLAAYQRSRQSGRKGGKPGEGAGLFAFFGGDTTQDDEDLDGLPRRTPGDTVHDKLALGTITPGNKTINVFSIASGHLYERFLSIMMYTARRVTQAPLKFWFLKQFLSPQFKRSLPSLSAKYGFDFELVSYHWPRWLRHQTEKQRVIWGYKILFLDVLFPLDVERVIFVDADQIVREDLNALHTLDLQGASYAFTPFCSQPQNRRLETKGFRFWESGYWKDTLQGLPYHISALFVVDLKRFRQQAAGDVLRSAYHQLSADPGSLANLDQDLPNVLQRQLPIFSLPEEWLWCGTWCTDESLASAKSIDLCQNPMTKKGKLDMAREIDPEWTKWDAELTHLRQSVDAQFQARDEAVIQAL